MGNYKNGLETKNLIYTKAKKLFIENGFSETTVRDIAEQTNVKVSLINYYFESKDDLGCAVHKELTDNINTAVEKLFKINAVAPESAIEYHVVSYMVYFEFYYQLPKAAKLYCALCGTSKFPATLMQELKYYTHGILDIDASGLYHEDLRSQAYFDTLHSILCGMEIQLMQDLILGRLSIPFHQAIDIYLHIYFQHLFSDTNYIGELIPQARARIANIQCSFDENYGVTIVQK